MESLSGNLGGHHTWLGICKACLACPRSWVPTLCLPAFGKHHPLVLSVSSGPPCIVSDTFRASRPGCPGPSRGKEPSPAFCSVPDSPFRLQIPPQRPRSYPWINCILPSPLRVSQGTELPSPVIPPCGFLKGLIICNAQIGFLLCPCNHWPACNLPSVKSRSCHAPSSIDTLVQEVKTQRNEPPCAQPCRQTPCHPLPTNSHLVSLHSFVSPLPPSHCPPLECSVSSSFSPYNLSLTPQNLVQMIL